MPTPEQLPDAKGKGTAGKVFQWLVIASMALGLIHQYIFPQTDRATEETIDEIVHEELHSEVVKELEEKYEERIEEAEKEHARQQASITGLLSKIHGLENQIKSLQEIDEGIIKQVGFNTHNGNIRDEAIFDLMNEDGSCSKVRYSKQKVDRYVMFNDWYGAKTLQPIIAGSGCRVRVVPFDRNRIEIQ